MMTIANLFIDKITLDRRSSAMTQTQDTPIVVLYGSLRSGTTLLRLVLDSHPGMTCPGERDFLLDYWMPDGRLDRDGLADDRIFRSSGLDLPDGDDPGTAFRQMLAQERARTDGVLVVVLHRGLAHLLDLLPDVPIIHLLRDPRDVAKSSIEMGWAGTTWHGVGHWIETEQAMRDQAPRLRPGQRLEVRYEALIGDHVAGLTRLCGFVGLPFDPAMLAYHQTSSYGLPDPSRAYQWRHKQAPQDIALVEYRVGPLLAACGYEPSGHPVVAPGRVLRMRLTARNVARRWGLRFARYGVVDPVLATIAYRTGRPGLGRKARLRMSEIDINHLK